MRLWVGVDTPTDGFIKDTVVHAASVINRADWLSFQEETGELVDGFDFLRVIHQAAAYPLQVLGIHERDPEMRAILVDKVHEYYDQIGRASCRERVCQYV